MSDGAMSLSDETLQEICGVSPQDLEVIPALMDELRVVRQLVPSPGSREVGRMEHALTMLASAIGRMPRHNLTHLPFGYQGPTVTSYGWVDRRRLESVAKQIVGLLWIDCEPKLVDGVVGPAFTRAVNQGMIEEKEYDAWRPGMASGSVLGSLLLGASGWAAVMSLSALAAAGALWVRLREH